MAASSKIGGYRCEFKGDIPEDFVCKHCKHVAREPHVTSCCSETFCQLCITSIIEDKKPCPSCETAEYSTSLNIKYQRRILALEAYCTVKDRGCEWSSKLEDLEAHLDAKTGDCEYVDIECPNKCDQPLVKHNLPTHLANSCPKREFTCQYCNFKAAYEVVTNDHWPQCSFYPVPCPNACGIQAIERGDLEAHLLQCPLEEVECDFSNTGCNTKLLRKDLEKHMEESAQKHLALMPAMTLRMQQKNEKLQRELENERHKIEAMKTQQEQLQKKTQENEEEIKDLKQQLQQKERKAEALGDDIEMPNFKQYKDNQEVWYSPPQYTHPGGYRFGIAVCADAGSGRMDVYFYSVTGNFDRLLKWNTNCTITLQLLNQERDQDHVVATKTFCMSQITVDKGYVILGSFGNKMAELFGNTSIVCMNSSHKDLEYNAQKETCYLKNNCLLFRVAKVNLN